VKFGQFSASKNAGDADRGRASDKGRIREMLARCTLERGHSCPRQARKRPSCGNCPRFPHGNHPSVPKARTSTTSSHTSSGT
jgi:hypothetical protein